MEQPGIKLGEVDLRPPHPRARADPDVDRDLGAVRRRRAAVERARVLLAVGQAVVEHDRGALEQEERRAVSENCARIAPELRPNCARIAPELRTSIGSTWTLSFGNVVWPPAPAGRLFR